ncbi:hypothetical protein ACNF49_28595 [Actinomadura sp. ATCC 39365]
MTAAFIRFVPDDVDDLAAFLTGEEWPFHVGGRRPRPSGGGSPTGTTTTRTNGPSGWSPRASGPGITRIEGTTRTVAYGILRSDRESGEVTPVAWADEPRP